MSDLLDSWHPVLSTPPAFDIYAETLLVNQLVPTVYPFTGASGQGKRFGRVHPHVILRGIDPDLRSLAEGLWVALRYLSLKLDTPRSGAIPENPRRCHSSRRVRRMALGDGERHFICPRTPAVTRQDQAFSWAGMPGSPDRSARACLATSCPPLQPVKFARKHQTCP